MTEEKERGVVSPNAPEGKATTAIVTADQSGVKQPEIVTKRSRRPIAPYWEPPQSHRQCDEKIRALMRGMIKDMSDYAYRLGRYLLWKQDRMEHGEWLPWAKEMFAGIHSIRTLQYYMAYVDLFDRMAARGKRIEFNSRLITKNATVAYLEVIDDANERPLGGAKRQKHEGGESIAWSATDCAQALLQRFEKLTAGRTPDECDEVRVTFDELARDFIEEKAASRLKIRGEDE